MQEGLDELFAFVPELLAAVAILIIGYFVAKVVGGLVARVLQRAGLDRLVHEGPAGDSMQKVMARPARLVGRLTFWVLFLGAVSLAVTALGIEALSAFVGEIFAYLPNVLAAVLIFLVAGAIATGVTRLARGTMGDTGLGRIVGTAAPILVMAIAGFMILEQLQIAPEIVRITYAAIIGAIALGSALAFGLGGRDVARQMLESAYETGQERKDEFRRDLDRGVSRDRGEAQPSGAGAQEAPVTTADVRTPRPSRG